jgi:uncharacterized protein (DUF2141 family)
MKKLLLSLAIAATSLLSAQDFKIEVEITGFKNDKGAALIVLYNTKDSFLRKGIQTGKTVVKNKKAYIVFSNLPKGEYAVSMYHDENANGKLDANFVGIPKEGYASSNGAKGFMGPPKFEDAKFSLSTNRKMVIKIN